MFDVVDIELGRQGLTPGQGVASSLFTGARLGVGRQLGDRTFVSANTGLCQVGSLLGGNGASSNINPLESIGVKLDYRLNENLGLSAGYEPSTTTLLCTTSITARRFAPTPPQWGLDIFRTWRF